MKITQAFKKAEQLANNEIKKQLLKEGWKFLREISENDTMAIGYYSELERKNEVKVLKDMHRYTFEVYVPVKNTLTNSEPITK